MVRGGSPLGSGAGASADQLAVRRHNLSLVLTHLRAVGPRSRAKVAAETGLNKATVSSLVAELVERGLVAEGETERGAVGRPSQQINLDGTNFFTVGTEINVDYLAALAMNVRGEVVVEQRISVDAARLGVASVLQRLSRLITTLVQPLTARGGRFVGLTVAVPGLTERSTGTVLRGAQPRVDQHRGRRRPASAAGRPAVPDPARQRGQPGRPGGDGGRRPVCRQQPDPAHRRRRRRRRDRRRRAADPRQSGTGRRGRPHAARPGRRDVRLRPPRLLGDRGRAERAARRRPPTRTTRSATRRWTWSSGWRPSKAARRPAIPVRSTHSTGPAPGSAREPAF